MSQITRSYQVVVKLIEPWLAPDGKTVLHEADTLVWLESQHDEFRKPTCFWDYEPRSVPNSYFKTFAKKPTKEEVVECARTMWHVQIHESDMALVEFVTEVSHRAEPVEF